MDLLSLNYRNAIILNNIGVNLMCQKALTEANDTLRDALHIMKTLTQTVPPSHEQLTSLDSNTRVSLASKRLAKATSYHRQDHLITAPHLFPASHSSSTAAQVRFLHPTTNSDVSVSQLLQDPRSSLICPCRIEMTDFECIQDRDSDFDSAMILYNFGLVRVCRAIHATHSHPQESVKGHLGAVHLFEMSESILSKAHAECCDDEQRLHVLSIILHSIVRSLLQLGEQEKASEYWKFLLHVRDEVIMLDDMGFTHKPIAASAA